MEGITAEKVQKLSKAYAKLAEARAHMEQHVRSSKNSYQCFVLNEWGHRIPLNIPSMMVRELLLKETRDKEDILKLCRQ